MKLTNRLLIGAAVCMLPAFAFATTLPVTLDSPTVSFTNPSGGSNITFPTIPGYDAAIRWGTPTSKNPGKNSGLGFTTFDSPLDTQTGEAFDLGELGHFNWEVHSGTAASGVDLNFGFTITDPDAGTFNFIFPLTINETSNSPPCVEEPVPADNYCPDIITFTNPSNSTVLFSEGGVDYTLTLLGFGPTADGILDQFVTQEGGVDSTHLWGKIDTATPPVGVPEPNALLLMVLGLLGLGCTLQLRRKQNKV